MTWSKGSLYSSHACSSAYTRRARESKKCVGLILQIHQGQLVRPHRAGKGHLAGQVSVPWKVVSASAEMGPADSSLAEQGRQRPHSSGLGSVLEEPVFGRNPRDF